MSHKDSPITDETAILMKKSYVQKLRLDYAFLQELANLFGKLGSIQCGGRRSFEPLAQSGRRALGVGLHQGVHAPRGC